jgi:hypothetical protein
VRHIFIYLHLLLIKECLRQSPSEPNQCRLWTWSGRVSFLVQVAIFLFAIMSKPALGPTWPSVHWVLGASFPGVRQLECMADCTPPSRLKLRMWEYIWTVRYISGLWHLIKHKGNFTFTLFFVLLENTRLVIYLQVNNI